MALKVLRGYCRLWSVMVISERTFCGRYYYIRTYGHHNVILFFRYDTFIKSRGGDFGQNSTRQGKATLA